LRSWAVLGSSDGQWWSGWPPKGSLLVVHRGRRKARTVLGWAPSDPATTLRTSVRWHLANPPADASDDFSADDAVLG
jgi:hypothetical protein